MRCHNFSAGPGALPDSVLEEASAGLACLPDVPLSILGVSHRSRWFTDMVDEAEANVRSLMGLSDDFECLFLQGGGSLQFSMIAMNFLRGQALPAAYVDSGYWSAKSIPEARKEGAVEVLWSGKAEGYVRLPEDSVFPTDRDFAYLHYASNETVEGLQFFREPPCSAATPRIVDMSSDFFARPVDCGLYDMIYAHAQKNFGPAGVCICLLHKKLLERIPEGLHAMLDYRNHIKMRSAYNTPPVFAIYVVLLVTRWLRDEIGGLAAMEAINQEKAARLYALMRPDGFYRCRSVPEARSLMNIAFRIADPALESIFVAEAEAAGLYGLEGHRSIGGLRASLYNPVTLEAVDALAAFMQEFERRYG
jgi:phosphoserine aminotransferase